MYFNVPMHVRSPSFPCIKPPMTTLPTEDLPPPRQCHHCHRHLYLQLTTHFSFCHSQTVMIFILKRHYLICYGCHADSESPNYHSLLQHACTPDAPGCASGQASCLPSPGIAVRLQTLGGPELASSLELPFQRWAKLAVSACG